MNIDLAINNEVDSDIADTKKQIEDTWNKLIHLEEKLVKLHLYRKISNLYPHLNDRQLHFSQANSGSGAARSEGVDGGGLSISERGISVTSIIDGTFADT
jgi:hypothetical protein